MHERDVTKNTKFNSLLFIDFFSRLRMIVDDFSVQFDRSFEQQHWSLPLPSLFPKYFDKCVALKFEKIMNFIRCQLFTMELNKP